MFQEDVKDRGDGRLNDPYIHPIFARSDNEDWGTIHMIVGMGGRRGDLCPRKVRPPWHPHRASTQQAMMALNGQRWR